MNADANTISLVLAFVPLVALVGGLWNRISADLGIGWQFIRFIVLATGIPVIGILTLQGMMDKNSAYALLAAALGYAFGKAAQKD